MGFGIGAIGNHPIHFDTGNHHMTQLSNATLEGRLLAQRQALGALLAACGQVAGPLSGWVRAFVADAFAVHDGSEDPGAVPDAAFAVEQVIAEEKRLLASEARRKLDAGASLWRGCG